MWKTHHVYVHIFLYVPPRVFQVFYLGLSESIVPPIPMGYERFPCYNGF